MTTVYVIRRTDPTKPSFVIQPYTTNGPASPNNSVPLFRDAVGANSTLVLMGKGEFDYGQPIQQDLFYMLENFSNSTSPALGVLGQLWFNNTDNSLNVCTDETLQTYTQLFYADGSIPFAGNLDMGGFKVINMGNPTAAQDAVTKTYSDTNLAAHASNFTLHMTPDQNTWFDAVVPGPVPLATPTEVGFLSGVTSSIQTQLNAKLNLDGSNSPMTGALDLGSFKITSLATPTAGTDGANKFYVDNAILAALGSVVGFYVLKAGDTMTGNLTIPAQAYPQPSSNFATTVQYVNDAISSVAPIYTIQSDPPQPASYLRNQLNLEAGSTITVETAIDYIDTGLDPVIRNQNERYVAVGTGAQKVFVMGFDYVVESNRLTGFVSGTKQYHDIRAVGTVSFDIAPTLFDDTGLAVGVYTFNLAIDGAAATLITVTVGATPFTFLQLISSIQTQMALAVPPVPATLVFDRGVFYFWSNRQGNTNAINTRVTITDITLWAAINPFVSTITSSPAAPVFVGAYKEGYINDPANAINAVITGLGGTWTVTGNIAAFIVQGMTFVVEGNTDPASNLPYTVFSATDVGPNTDIVVDGTFPLLETIPATATATGSVQFYAGTFANNGSVTFNVAPAVANIEFINYR